MARVAATVSEKMFMLVGTNFGMGMWQGLLESGAVGV